MDPDLARLLDLRKSAPRSMMTIKQVSDCLEVSYGTANRLVNSQQIQARKLIGKGDGSRCNARISYEAVMIYLVRSTSGDRMSILEDIKEHARDWYPMARTVAAVASKKERRPAVAVSQPGQFLGELFAGV